MTDEELRQMMHTLSADDIAEFTAPTTEDVHDRKAERRIRKRVKKRLQLHQEPRIHVYFRYSAVAVFAVLLSLAGVRLLRSQNASLIHVPPQDGSVTETTSAQMIQTDNGLQTTQIVLEHDPTQTSVVPSVPAVTTQTDAQMHTQVSLTDTVPSQTTATSRQENGGNATAVTRTEEEASGNTPVSVTTTTTTHSNTLAHSDYTATDYTTIASDVTFSATSRTTTTPARTHRTSTTTAIFTMNSTSTVSETTWVYTEYCTTPTEIQLTTGITVAATATTAAEKTGAPESTPLPIRNRRRYR